MTCKSQLGSCLDSFDLNLSIRLSVTLLLLLALLRLVSVTSTGITTGDALAIQLYLLGLVNKLPTNDIGLIHST